MTDQNRSQEEGGGDPSLGPQTRCSFRGPFLTSAAPLAQWAALVTASLSGSLSSLGAPHQGPPLLRHLFSSVICKNRRKGTAG